MGDATCVLIVNGVRCPEPVHVKKRGWCRKHWRRWQYAGDPLAPDRRHEKLDPEVRFLEKVNKNGAVPAHRPELGPCWMWTGALGGGQKDIEAGYGTFWVDGVFFRAHRWSYEHFTKRQIPEGLEIDHLCHPGDGSCLAATCPHHACVNPDHLEPVTHRENGIRGNTVAAANAVKTHCPKGHPYDEENTQPRKLPSGNTGRWCRQCSRENSAARRGPRAEKTHCRKGHPWTEENILVQKNGVRRCRICCKAQWTRANAKARAKRIAAQEEASSGMLF